MPFTNWGRSNFNRDSERNQQRHGEHINIEMPNRNSTGGVGSRVKEKGWAGTVNRCTRSIRMAFENMGPREEV